MPAASTRHIEPLLPGSTAPAGPSRRGQAFPVQQLVRRSRVARGFVPVQQPRYKYSRSVTINHQKVGATDLTNFPVLVGGTLPWLRTTGNGGQVEDASGFDVGFYSDPQLTQKLDWQVDKYTATTGLVAYWVRIPTVSAAVDTVFYIGYGDATINFDQTNPTAVWDSTFMAAYHLGDGTTLSLADATANARALTNNGAATAAAGQINGGVNLASASTQFLSRAGVNVPAAATLSAWVKATSLPNAYNTIIGLHAAAITPFIDLFVKSTGKIAAYFRVVGGTQVNYDGTGVATLSTGTWYHVAATYVAGTGLVGYVNGVQDGNIANANALDQTAGPGIEIGQDTPFAPRTWNGVIDEPRIANVARSASWVLAEYNNQLNPDTFYTFDLMPSERTLRRPYVRRPMLRRRVKVYPVNPSTAAPVAPDIVNQPRVPRPMRHGRRPPPKPVPPQLAVPAAVDQVQQPHRIRGASRRAVRRVEVVPVVTTPPVDASVMWSPLPRKVRWLLGRKRPTVEVVPPQFNPPFPFTEVVQPKRLRGLLARRAQRVEIPLEQLAPRVPSARRQRPSLRVRRSRPVEVVQVQTAAPVDPSVMWSPTRAPRRTLVARRRARVEVVPTQAAPVVDASVMWSPARAPRRVLVRRPRRGGDVVSAQAAPAVVARAQRRTLLRRPRRPVEVVPTQAAPVVDPSVMWSPTRAPRRALVLRRRARVETVPAQLNPPFPFRAITQPRRVRGVQPRRRARVETPSAKRIYFPKIRLF